MKLDMQGLKLLTGLLTLLEVCRPHRFACNDPQFLSKRSYFFIEDPSSCCLKTQYGRRPTDSCGSFPSSSDPLTHLPQPGEHPVHLGISRRDQISGRSLQSQNTVSLESIAGHLPITLGLPITRGGFTTSSDPLLIDGECRCCKRTEHDTNESEHSVRSHVHAP